jgi:hypothetical protein
MKQYFKSGLVIFHFLGFHKRNFSSEKSFRENLGAIWFYSMLTIYSCLLFFNLFTVGVDSTDLFTKFIFYPAFWFVNCSALLNLFLVMKMAPVENEFWKLTEDFQRLFRTSLQRGMQIKMFGRLAVQKLLGSLGFFNAANILGIILATQSPDSERAVKLGKLGIVFLFILRAMTMKFSFYVEVLHCCLFNIELKMSERRVTVREMDSMRETFTLCKKMCDKINKIFGWNLVLFVTETFIIGLYSGYNICKAISTKKFEFLPFLAPFSHLFAVWMFIAPCIKCMNCSRRIVSLAFRKSAPDFHKAIERFALQAMNQKIIFGPLNIFTINENLISNVSKGVKNFKFMPL